MGAGGLLLVATAYWFWYFRKAAPAAYFDALYWERFRNLPENELLVEAGLPKHEARAGEVVWSWVMILGIAAYFWFSRSFSAAAVVIAITIAGGLMAWVLGKIWLILFYKKRIDTIFKEMDKYTGGKKNRDDNIRFF